MRWPMKFCLSALAVLILACFLRGCCLDIRPMHGDEAVHADKFGRLLEQNYYRYDPKEFHGPTLNYFTLIPARLSGKHTYAAVTESTLRIVPAFFGLLLVIMPLLLADGLGKTTAIIAGAITAISPAFVFYSRYYIQEMLLVCFTFAVVVCGYRYSQSKSCVWALLTGVFAGLCAATKETWIISFGSMIITLVIMMLVQRKIWKLQFSHLLLAIAGALAVWVLFYSSFFTNPAGLTDSICSFKTYFGSFVKNRAHFHPWYYYLKLLIYNKASMGPPWTEAAVVILAAAGLVAAVTNRRVRWFNLNLLNFLALYTVIMAVIYSALPYKTPWCLLSFYYGMILLAAVGVVALLNSLSRAVFRMVVSAFLVTVAVDLVFQAFAASFISYTDPANPYVYAHPTKDVLTIAKRVEDVSKLQQVRREAVWVVCPDNDYWPLPWYLRSVKNVGWCSDVNEIRPPAPIVIASAGLEDKLLTKLYDLSPAGEKNLYVPLFAQYVELRPGVELRGYVIKDIIDKLQKSNAGH
jgi:uncharacterized protein (TIGR03663 family)